MLWAARGIAADTIGLTLYRRTIFQAIAVGVIDQLAGRQAAPGSKARRRMIQVRLPRRKATSRPPEATITANPLLIASTCHPLERTYHPLRLLIIR
jgi:hypothetical protein